MIPDLSFVLHVPITARRSVLASLAALCATDRRGELDRPPPTDFTADVCLELPLAGDAALADWRAAHARLHEGVPTDRVKVGSVVVWIKASGNTLEVVLWPVSRAMQDACMGSATVRTLLVAILREHEGVGYIDQGDGSWDEFWPVDLTHRPPWLIA